MTDTSQYETGEYLAKNPEWHQYASQWKAEQIKRLLDQNPLSLKSIVEVGCGAGKVIFELSKLLPDDCEFRGYDISPQAIDLSNQYRTENLSFVNGDFLEEGSKVYDLLLVIDVFEHVEDYMGFLRKLRGRGNYYCFHIPLDMHVLWLLRERQIRVRDEIGHLHYFSKATALRTLEDTGYTVLDYFYTKGMLELPNRKKLIGVTVMNIPRRLLFPFVPDFTVRLLGGFSLMVLAK